MPHDRIGKWRLLHLLIGLSTLLGPATFFAGAPNGSQLLDEARRHHRQGQLQEALTAYEAAEPLLKQEKNLAGLAVCLNNSSVIHYGRGEFKTALKLARQAVDLRLDLGDVHLAGRSLTNAGRALAALGQLAAAEETYREALAAARQAADRRDEVINQVNLGVLAQGQGRYGDALAATEAGLEVVDSAPGAGWSHVQRRILLNNRGVIYERIGEFRRALNDYQELLSLLGPGLESVPYRINMATILRNLGDPNLALEQLQKAEEMLDARSNPALMANLLSNVGLVEHLDLKHLEIARAVLERAYDLARQAGQTSESLTIGNALADVAIDASQLDLAARTLTELLHEVESDVLLEPAWKTHLEMSRLLEARGDESGSTRALETAAVLLEGSRSNLDRRFTSRRFLVDRMEVYARLAEQRARGGTGADFRGALRASERARQHLLLSRWRRRSTAAQAKATPQQRLARLSAAAARTYEAPTPANLQRWRQMNRPWPPATADRRPSLTPDLVVVEYLLAGTHSRVFWMSRETSGSRPLPAESRIEKMAARWLSSMGQGAQHDRQEMDAGRALFEDLLQPILAQLPTPVTRLWIVPDGLLWRLPWDALPLSGQEPRRLLERYETTLLPSLAFAAQPPAPHAAEVPTGTFLFLGPPEPAPPGLRPLPEAGAEANALQKVWPQGGSILLGKAATEGMFRKNLGRHLSLLHLATHAVANPLDPGRTGLFFTPGKQPDAVLFRPHPSGMRQGLPFSRHDDGFLSLPEILDLHLDVDLAFLSACSGQSGESIPGEGLFSLSSSLQEAGAGAVIASLWAVEDLPARALVQQFYFHLGRGATASSALRRAKLALLRAGGPMAQPARWAGWVIIGRGEIRLRPASLQRRYKIWLLAIALLFTAAYLWRRAGRLRV